MSPRILSNINVVSFGRPNSRVAPTVFDMNGACRGQPVDDPLQLHIIS